MLKNDVVAIKSEDQECAHNGVNIMRIPARDAYAYGLHLMDIHFCKEEPAMSLLFKSKKVTSLA